MEDKVLIIEDDLTTKPLWEHVARRNFGPGNMDWAVNVEEAIRLFQTSIRKNEPYSLVVTDVFLAGSKTGLDFIVHARSLGQRTPILLISAAEETELKKSVDSIFAPFEVLSKPLSVPKCERMLEKIFTNRQNIKERQIT